jgi:lysine 2,3-aminomutase
MLKNVDYLNHSDIVSNEETWQVLLRQGIDSAEELSQHIPINVSDVKAVLKIYPMKINDYFLKLIKIKGSSLIKQVLPDIRELKDNVGLVDPLAEERDCPAPGITHRYPDRILFLISNTCSVYCRFCTRKRKVGLSRSVTYRMIEEGLYYIQSNKNIRDVLISGGDPLILSDERLNWILCKIKEISHVDIIRIGTRVPCVLPQRINTKLVKIIKKSHPIYIIIHFNHPYEITKEVKRACGLLADAGIPLASQTVLLRGINDNYKVIIKLMRELLKLRVRPYYLHHCDLSKGTGHFRTRIEKGISILKQIRGHISGLAVPHYVIDLPGGGGKVPILPKYLKQLNENQFLIKNYQGHLYEYSQPTF